MKVCFERGAERGLGSKKEGRAEKKERKTRAGSRVGAGTERGEKRKQGKLEISSEVLEMRAWSKPSRSVFEGRFLKV